VNKKIKVVEGFLIERQLDNEDSIAKVEQKISKRVKGLEEKMENVKAPAMIEDVTKLKAEAGLLHQEAKLFKSQTLVEQGTLREEIEKLKTEKLLAVKKTEAMAATIEGLKTNVKDLMAANRLSGEVIKEMLEVVDALRMQWIDTRKTGKEEVLT
jgi:hypothetical protein